MSTKARNSAGPEQVSPFGGTGPHRPVRLLLTPLEAAAALAVSERTLWAHTYPRGPIGCVHIGRAVRYDVEDLRAWIEASKERAHVAP